LAADRDHIGIRFSSDKNMYISSALACSRASTVTVEVLTTLEPAALCFSSAFLARTSPGGAGEYFVAKGGVAVPDSEDAMSFPCVATRILGNSLNFEMRTGWRAAWRKERKPEEVDDHSNWQKGVSGGGRGRGERAYGVIRDTVDAFVGDFGDGHGSGDLFFAVGSCAWSSQGECSGFEALTDIPFHFITTRQS
jgi:hypothetical protein